MWRKSPGVACISGRLSFCFSISLREISLANGLNSFGCKEKKRGETISSVKTNPPRLHTRREDKITPWSFSARLQVECNFQSLVVWRFRVLG